MAETSESVMKTFFLNTTFHGFRFIVEKRRHWMERVFWTICCVLSWIATGLLFYSSWKDFQNNAISFVVETSYLDWNTNFPSVVVCETDNQENIARTTDKTFGDPHDYNLDEMVKELVFYRGISFYTLQVCGADVPNRTENCFLRNFSYFSDEVKSSCKEIFRICKWHGREFDCCKYFREIDSEFGKCYAVNSIQTRDISPPVYKMVSNRLTGAGTLYLELNGITSLYTFGEQEVPSLTSLANDVMQITPHIRYQRYFAIKEIDNQQEVREVSIEQRKCRFPEESKSIDVHRHYSYSACCVQCRKEAQLRQCGCVHHLMPNTTFEQHCGFHGLQCLNINYNQIAVLRASWANRTGLVCGCLPSCTEIELSIIRDDKTGIVQEYAIVELTLEKLPTERFKRNIVRGKLDLVVSMGGAIALFLGASILSFVEVIYYFFVRPLSDLTRQKWNKKKKRTELDKIQFSRNNSFLPRVT